MHKWAKILLSVLLVLFAGVIAWQMLQPDEPVYHGKPLSSWLKAYGKYTGEVGYWKVQAPEADEAVRQAGTNALPMPASCRRHAGVSSHH